MKNNRSIGLRLPDKIYRQIETIAGKEGRSVADIIRRMIVAALENKKKKK